MAAVRRAQVAALILAGCGKTVGFGGAPTPLASIRVALAGDAPAGATRLRVALVWGAQWLPEAFCILPPESDAAAAAIQAGCPDSFGFVPARVAANAAIAPGAPATLDLYELPAADVMVGDVTARVAYGSLIVYDDRNDSGTLELRRSARDLQDLDAGVDTTPGTADVVYGASFVSMTQPDQRVAYREGDFNEGAAFYPRHGCAAPPRGFSILEAGGFSQDAAIAAALQGQLPSEDAAACGEQALDAATVQVALQPAGAERQVACLQRRTSGVPRYREPPADSPDLTSHVWACAGLPHFPGSDVVDPQLQLVIAGAPDDPCKSLTHYTLRGCDNNISCTSPEWDHTAVPPSWWPCASAP